MNNQNVSDNKQNLANDYRDSTLEVTQVQLKELQDTAEAQNHLLLQANPGLLLKYPAVVTDAKNQSRIVHML